MAVACPGGQDDLDGLGVLDRDHGDVRPQAAAEPGRRQGHHLTARDQLQLVLQRLHQRAQIGVAGGIRPDPVGSGEAGEGLVGEVRERDRLLAGQPVADRDQEDARLVVEDPDVQVVGAEQEPGHHDIDAVVEQRVARLVPVHVLGADVGPRVAVAQLAYGRGDDLVGGVTDGERAARGGGSGARGGPGGGPQQLPGLRQKGLPGLGEPGAARGAVKEPDVQLPLQTPDLTAQRGLGEMQRLGGAAEVQFLGDHGEVAHQAQLQVHRRYRGIGHPSTVAPARLRPP